MTEKHYFLSAAISIVILCILINFVSIQVFTIATTVAVVCMFRVAYKVAETKQNEWWEEHREEEMEKLKKYFEDKKSAEGLIQSVTGIDYCRVSIDYTNYRGKRKQYEILPEKIYFGSNEYHTEPQWLMNAKVYDGDEIKERNFAMRDIHSWNECMY